MEQFNQPTVGDRLQWESENKAHFSGQHLIMPTKYKHLQKVYLTWNRHNYQYTTYEAYLLYGPTICGHYDKTFTTLLGSGDTFECFIIPKRGGVMKGLHTLWLCDVGIGKTKKEAEENYCKYHFFKRGKSTIINDAYWHQVRENRKYNNELA